MPADAAADRTGPATALALMAEGRTREAGEALQSALAAGGGPGAAWRLLGDIRLAAGDVKGAQGAYDRMLCAVVPDARLRAAAIDLAEGRLAAAEQALRAVLALEPQNAGAAHLVGELLARRGHLPAAEAALAQALAVAPQLHLARLAHGLVLQRLGKPIEAIAELDALLAREPRHVRARMAKAASLSEVGDYAAAVVINEALAAEFPDQLHGWLILGHGLRTLGRTEAAIAAFRRVLGLDPGCGEAWWSLANLKAYRFNPDERAAMSAARARPDLTPEDASALGFALAKAHEDAGQDAEAFAAYAQANTVQRRLRGYDADRTSALVRRSKALFTAGFFAARAGWGDPAPDPIFIVGLPRSGSTLVEQILASHPMVEGTRELPDIQMMADWAGAQSPRADGYPDVLAGFSREVVRQLGHDYLARTRLLRRLGRPRFLDKAPWNCLHTGFIHLILPNARIVDVRRHPMACGFSAFTQHFAGGFDFAYDLTDLGRYYADYVDLMAHVDAAAPGLVHRVIYEDLVVDTEAQVRALLNALGLPFDDACLRFFETERPVATPSSQQVRQPIFASAVDHWRRFEPWLAPLKSALGPTLDAYPAAPQSGS